MSEQEKRDRLARIIRACWLSLRLYPEDRDWVRGYIFGNLAGLAPSTKTKDQVVRMITHYPRFWYAERRT